MTFHPPFKVELVLATFKSFIAGPRNFVYEELRAVTSEVVYLALNCKGFVLLCQYILSQR